MKTILFLYSLGNQHSADLPFHVTCYRCCLQLPQFAAHVVWTNSVTFAMFHCILYRKSLLIREICFSYSLQCLRGPFLHCHLLFTSMTWSSVRKWPIPRRWPEVGEYDGGWSASRSQSILLLFFCHQIQNKWNKIMFIIFMNNTRQHNTNFTFITFPKSKIHAGKLQLGHTLLSPFIVKQPYYNVWRCSNIKFSCLYNYQQTYSY